MFKGLGSLSMYDNVHSRVLVIAVTNLGIVARERVGPLSVIHPVLMLGYYYKNICNTYTTLFSYTVSPVKYI